MNLKHFTIPLFIPMQGCPFDCVFCNQRNITGQQHVMSDDEIGSKIESHLSTLPKENSIIEIGFFGGSFTGLPIDEQKHYLKLVQPWIESGEVTGIRLSTRPDYINAEILAILKDNGVKTIELGVQSMDDEMLRKAGRGHTAEDIQQAATLIKESGFSLGLQMMIGLPGDTIEKSMQTAQEIIKLEADSTRIYPTLVIRHTGLESLHKQGKFEPLSLEEAVNWCSKIVPLFEEAGVNILRLGLHPSEGILRGDELVAGPFHVAFGEMVYSKIWKNILRELKSEPSAEITIFMNPKQINHAIGHKGMNRKMLELRFGKVNFRGDDNLVGRRFVKTQIPSSKFQAPSQKSKAQTVEFQPNPINLLSN
ncbi:MAG: radical SAM protein [Bacteroidales bacterium]|nr:radical SAM protein [Bacteroidales bacterium]